MMLALLGLMTLAVVLLPLLPALHEWARPSDVVPLQIDDDDALDPGYLAQHFAERLAAALSAGDARLGRSAIVTVASAEEGLPLSVNEALAAHSRRLWHVHGAAELPLGVRFMGEVAVERDLTTAARGVYRALLAGGRLRLAPSSRVLRWAHAQDIEVGNGCHVAGRQSAERTISVGHSVRFARLHAPEISFDGPAHPSTADVMVPAPSVIYTGLPWPAQWDPASGRALATESMRIDAHQAWRGDLVCQGDLRLGPGCHVRGSIKTHGRLQLGAGCHVVGNLFAQGRVILGAGCVVQGCVISETAITLEPGCVVGAPTELVTVAAPQIDVAPAVRVHGSLWAELRGRSRRASAPVPLRAWAAKRFGPAAQRQVVA